MAIKEQDPAKRPGLASYENLNLPRCKIGGKTLMFEQLWLKSIAYLLHKKTLLFNIMPEKLFKRSR
jgi:hypothetical protein